MTEFEIKAHQEAQKLIKTLNLTALTPGQVSKQITDSYLAGAIWGRTQGELENQVTAQKLAMAIAAFNQIMQASAHIQNRSISRTPGFYISRDILEKLK